MTHVTRGTKTSRRSPPKKISDQNFFLTKNENYLWRNKTKLLNLRFSKLHSAKVLLKLEFDTEDQVLFHLIILGPVRNEV